TGTTSVLSGRWNDQVRLQLSQHAVAWVNASDVVPLPAGTPPAGGVVGSVRLEPGPAAVTLRVPLPGKLPFQVTEQERSLTLRVYGAGDRKSTRLNSSHGSISYAVFCLKKKKKHNKHKTSVSHHYLTYYKRNT